MLVDLPGPNGPYVLFDLTISLKPLSFPRIVQTHLLPGPVRSHCSYWDRLAYGIG